MKENYIKSIDVRCKCGKLCTYTLKNPKILPKRSRVWCANCKTQFYIKSSKLINSDRFDRLAHFAKIQEKTSSFAKISDKKIILKLLDKGLYAQEIVQRTSFSAHFVYKTITSLKKQGLITQIQAHPKIYKLTYKEKPFLENGEYAEKQAQNEQLERKIKPVWLKKLRVHKLRFKNELYHKPMWLYKFQREGLYNGIRVKIVNMNNWVKHVLQFHYNDFNGLEKIEVCNNVIIYNFNRIKEEQYVESKKSLQNYINDRIQDCKEARDFLLHNGFDIDSRDPSFCQNPHLAIQTKGTPGTLGALGKYLIATIKLPNETREIDDSPKLGEGEEETDNIEKAESIFDVPERIEKVEHTLSELIIEMKTDRKELLSGIKDALKNVFSSDLSNDEKEEKIKTDVERMFQ